MSKSINKNSISFALVLLAILALGAVFGPAKVNAQYDSSGDDGYDHFLYTSENPVPIFYSISPSSANQADPATNVTISGHGFTSVSIARWNGVNKPTTFIDSDHLIVRLTSADFNESAINYINVYNPKRNAYSTAGKFKINDFVAGGANNVNNGNTNQYNADGSLNANYSGGASTTNTKNSGGSVSSLASNAIFGINSLVPTGIIQWILFLIIVLLIVILVRRIMGSSEKYHNSPLKHS